MGLQTRCPHYTRRYKPDKLTPIYCITTMYNAHVDARVVPQDRVESLTNNIVCKDGIISPH